MWHGTKKIGETYDIERSRTTCSIACEQSLLVSSEADSKLVAMSISTLAALCKCEIGAFDHEDASRTGYGLELLRRATIDGCEEARAFFQECLSEVARNWLHRHPQYETLCLRNSKEYYLTRTFERFWQITIPTQEGAICSLQVALRYLRASLNGVLLETLRAYSEPGESYISDSHEAEVRLIQKKVSGSEVWAVIQHIIHDAREQRLVYLLFHCGLSPREVLRCCPQEFDDLCEISQLRYTLLEHLLRSTDQFPW